MIIENTRKIFTINVGVFSNIVIDDDGKGVWMFLRELIIRIVS
jgi:hypothetical protein